MDNALPAIPAKRYFTIGEVSDLCGVKPYVLRYWEQEFIQLKPMKRRGNRRYYQHHEVLLIRRIRGLLYDQGFTISGARNQLMDGAAARGADAAQMFKQEADEAQRLDDELYHEAAAHSAALAVNPADARSSADLARLSSLMSLEARAAASLETLSMEQLREELISIREGLLA